MFGFFHKKTTNKTPSSNKSGVSRSKKTQPQPKKFSSPKEDSNTSAKKQYISANSTRYKARFRREGKKYAAQKKRIFRTTKRK